MNLKTTCIALFILIVSISCTKKANQEASDLSHTQHHHVHQAPHGGILVEIGNHQFNVELLQLQDRWTLYILGAHAERFVRIKSSEIKAQWLSGQDILNLTFKAIANDATGEIIGNTSQFDLLNYPDGSGVLKIPELLIGGILFQGLEIPIP